MALIPFVHYFQAEDRCHGGTSDRNVSDETSRFYSSRIGRDATTTTPASKMAAPVMQTCHVACCANRTPNVVSWGRGGTIAFGSCHSVVLYDPQVMEVMKQETRSIVCGASCWQLLAVWANHGCMFQLWMNTRRFPADKDCFCDFIPFRREGSLICWTDTRDEWMLSSGFTDSTAVSPGLELEFPLVVY